MLRRLFQSTIEYLQAKAVRDLAERRFELYHALKENPRGGLVVDGLRVKVAVAQLRVGLWRADG